MITTADKPKLPPWLSYPIGAKVVSDNIADIAENLEFELSFTDVSELPRKEAERIHPYIVARACYDRNPIIPDWRIDIYSVPRTVKHKISSLIKETGLKNIRSWLEEERTETWHEGYSCLCLFYDEKQNLLKCFERNNASTLYK